MIVTKYNTEKWLILAGVWFLYMGFGLSMTSLAPLVADIENELNLTHDQMGQIMGAWQFVYIFAAIPCGLFLDKIGTRWGIAIGALIIGISGLSRGFSDNYYELLFSVGLFGLGGPLISAGAPKVIAQYFSGSSRGFAMGIYITGPGAGGIIALLLSQPILMPFFDNNWRFILQLWGIVMLFAGVLWIFNNKPRVVRPPLNESKSFDYRQIFQVLSIPTVRLVLIMGVGVLAIDHALVNWLVEILSEKSSSNVSASKMASILLIFSIVSALVLPRLATGHRRFSILGLVFIFSLTGNTLLFLNPGELGLYAGLVLQGIAVGSMMTILIFTLVGIPGVGGKRAGTASGCFFSAAEIGGVGGPVFLGLMYKVTGDFQSGLFTLMLISSLLLVAVVPLRKNLRKFV